MVHDPFLASHVQVGNQSRLRVRLPTDVALHPTYKWEIKVIRHIPYHALLDLHPTYKWEIKAGSLYVLPRQGPLHPTYKWEIKAGSLYAR